MRLFFIILIASIVTGCAGMKVDQVQRSPMLELPTPELFKERVEDLELQLEVEPTYEQGRFIELIRQSPITICSRSECVSTICVDNIEGLLPDSIAEFSHDGVTHKFIGIDCGSASIADP